MNQETDRYPDWQAKPDSRSDRRHAPDHPGGIEWNARYIEQRQPPHQGFSEMWVVQLAPRGGHVCRMQTDAKGFRRGCKLYRFALLPGQISRRAGNQVARRDDLVQTCAARGDSPNPYRENPN